MSVVVDFAVDAPVAVGAVAKGVVSMYLVEMVKTLAASKRAMDARARSLRWTRLPAGQRVTGRSVRVDGSAVDPVGRGDRI